jgi:uncharacterized protein (DUF433 family)
MALMATVDSVVQVDPEILGGTPVFRGTRVPVKNLLDTSSRGTHSGSSSTPFRQ